MRLARSRATSMLVLVIVLACRREPARSRELRFLDAALRARDSQTWERSVMQLERNPEHALRAVREQTAAEGTRDALLLRILEARLRNAADQRRRRVIVEQAIQRGHDPAAPIETLSRRRDALFWAELLLTSDDTPALMAAHHLARIGGTTADQALTLEVKTPQERPGTPMRVAAIALGNDGKGDVLLDAWLAWARARVAEPARMASASHLREGVRRLSAVQQRRLESRTMRILEEETISNAERRALLAALQEVVHPDMRRRVTKLRTDAPWSRELRGELDAVLRALLMREEERTGTRS